VTRTEARGLWTNTLRERAPVFGGENEESVGVSSIGIINVSDGEKKRGTTRKFHAALKSQCLEGIDSTESTKIGVLLEAKASTTYYKEKGRSPGMLKVRYDLSKNPHRMAIKESTKSEGTVRRTSRHQGEEEEKIRSFRDKGNVSSKGKKGGPGPLKKLAYYLREGRRITHQRNASSDYTKKTRGGSESRGALEKGLLSSEPGGLEGRESHRQIKNEESPPIGMIIRTVTRKKKWKGKPRRAPKLIGKEGVEGCS